MTIVNSDQRAAWNGESGRHWVASADRRDAVLAPIADLVLDAAGIEAGERVLDIGCGCGATTCAAEAATGPTGSAVGADVSALMLEVARARARARSHGRLQFLQADVQTDPLGGPFDVAISRFGTMFFDDPVTAFRNVVRHMSPGGRICFATWQPLEANQWLVIYGAVLREFGASLDSGDAHAPGMFAQSDRSSVEHILREAGFADITVQRHTLPLRFGMSVTDAVDYLANTGSGRASLETIAPDRHGEALAAVEDSLLAHHDPRHGVVLDAAVLLITARVQS